VLVLAVVTRFGKGEAEYATHRELESAVGEMRGIGELQGRPRVAAGSCIRAGAGVAARFARCS
jgi:hypothetical protein